MAGDMGKFTVDFIDRANSASVRDENFRAGSSSTGYIKTIKQPWKLHRTFCVSVRVGTCGNAQSGAGDE